MNPALDLANGRLAGGEDDVTLTLPEVPGFSLTVLAGSVRFPDGSATGTVSVTPVHADKIPMAPGSGRQPRFIVTVQPAGARFDPPAPVTFPNVDGLPPGTVSEVFSFDHDLGEFVTIGTATVSEDGLTVRSDPGFGIVKAGWHASTPPSPIGASASLTVEIREPSPVFLCAGAGASPREITAFGDPARDSVFSWTVDDESVVTLSPTGDGLCPDDGFCATTATAEQTGTTAATVRIESSTTGGSEVDTVEIVAASLTIDEISASELVLGQDLSVSYRVETPPAYGFDRAEIRVRNRSDTVVFRLPAEAGPGPHVATWQRGRWNLPPHAGAFANPNNGPYTVEMVGIRDEVECVGDRRELGTRLVLAAHVVDELPPGATASAVAGLGDLPDVLKVVMRSGSSETVLSGPQNVHATSVGPGAVHVEIDGAALDTLADGDYEVLFVDLRDAIGNYADADGDPTNGIQLVRFHLPLW